MKLVGEQDRAIIAAIDEAKKASGDVQKISEGTENFKQRIYYDLALSSRG